MLQKYLSDCEEYDEVSLNSETTLASEFVERQIAHFDNDLQNDFPANSDINRRVQVNLQVVESLNIYRENEGEHFSFYFQFICHDQIFCQIEISKKNRLIVFCFIFCEANEEGNESVQLKTISEITQAITQAVVLNRHEDQQNEYLLNRKKFFFGGFLTIMSLTLLVLTVFIAFSARDKQVLDNNKPKLAKPVELIFSRNKWIQDLGRIGSKHLKTHLKKVILFEKTLKQSSSCQEETCSDVAGNFYPNFEDLRENFVIATDGTIFEARGFDRESEAAFDDFGTSYNNDAISMEVFPQIFFNT